MTYFRNITTRAALKKQFRALAQIHHPDHGGDGAVMAAIISEYQILAATLRDDEFQVIQPEPAYRKFSCFPHRRTTSGGANPHLLRLASPKYSHKDICVAVRTLYTFGRANRRDATPISDLYREICDIFDPGQSKPYQDYYFNKKIARKTTEFIGAMLRSVFRPHVWSMLKLARERLAQG